MKKYYTPEIEEFHRGFVYEYKSNTMLGSLSNTNGEWKQVDFYGASGAEDEHSEMEDIEFALDAEKMGIEVRVKYLDKEDIESLGWKEVMNAIPSCHLFMKGQFSLYYYSEMVPIQIFRVNPSMESVFFGLTKNKSQLKDLMIQLGIKLDVV